MAEQTPLTDADVGKLQTHLQSAGLLNTGNHAEVSKAVAAAGLSTALIKIYKGQHYIFIVDK